MLKKILKTLILAAIVLVPCLAFAQDVPPIDPGNLFSQALDAIANKNWFLLSSVAVTAIIFVMRKYVFASPTGFFASKAGGYVMNGLVALLTAFAVALLGHGGEVFTSGVVTAALLAAVKSGAFAAFIYQVLQDALGMSSSPAVAK